MSDIINPMKHAKLRVAMRSEIKALHQRLKTTTVYVTHDHGRASVGPGERVSLEPQPAQAHLFDAASGRRIE